MFCPYIKYVKLYISKLNLIFHFEHCLGINIYVKKCLNKKNLQWTKSHSKEKWGESLKEDMAHQFNNLFHQHQIKRKNNHYLNFIYPQQVLTGLRKSNFTLLNRSIQFDDNGDPKFGSYSIIFWNHNGEAEEIGYYKFYPSVNFFINSTKIQWYNPGEVTCFSLLCAKYPDFNTYMAI